MSIVGYEFETNCVVECAACGKSEEKYYPEVEDGEWEQYDYSNEDCRHCGGELVIIDIEKLCERK